MSRPSIEAEPRFRLVVFRTGTSVYAVEPRSFLVIGNLAEVLGNDDKVACFELYRRNIRAPEILTFDELFQRASCIVENISKEGLGAVLDTESDASNDVPF